MQLMLFGRRLEGEADALIGYVAGALQVADEAARADDEPAYLVLRRGGLNDRVAGVAFRVTDAELIAADDYEAEDYRRVRVTLESGREAFVYIAAEEPET